MNKSEIINQIYSAELTKRATLVVFYLINRANMELKCFPGIKTIGRDCNMSARTVQRALNDLVKAAYVKREYRYRDNKGQSSNLYTLMNKADDRNESTEELGYIDEKKRQSGDTEEPPQESQVSNI